MSSRTEVGVRGHTHGVNSLDTVDVEVALAFVKKSPHIDSGDTPRLEQICKQCKILVPNNPRVGPIANAICEVVAPLAAELV